MKKLLLLLLFILGSFIVFSQEKPDVSQTKPQNVQVQKKEPNNAVKPNAHKEVPKATNNQARIQKTQQQRKQVKNAQMQQQRSKQTMQQQKMVQRRKNHK